MKSICKDLNYSHQIDVLCEQYKVVDVRQLVFLKLAEREFKSISEERIFTQIMQEKRNKLSPAKLSRCQCNYKRLKKRPKELVIFFEGRNFVLDILALAY